MRKILGKMTLNRVQTSFDVGTKTRTLEIIISCMIKSFQECSQIPVNTKVNAFYGYRNSNNKKGRCSQNKLYNLKSD